jgi:hypothetical protein
MNHWLPSAHQALVAQELDQFAGDRLRILAHQKGTTCWSLAPRGELVADVAEVLSDLAHLGYRLIAHDEDTQSYTLVHADGYIELELLSDRPISVRTLSKRQLAKLRTLLEKWLRTIPKKASGRLYMLQVECGCLEFGPVGVAGRILQRGNYPKVVLDAFDHVVSEIESPDPCGRLVLLNGPAGTGKTHLVRGLIGQAKRPRFVVVQAGDVDRLLDASPIAALMQFARGEARKRPIVLVIEDADGCLLPRGSDNISQISAILNLTDGLVGSAFDIRIVATTNAKQVEIDPAVLRPGRICRRVDVPPLGPEHATEVLAGVVGRAPRSPFRKGTTLAEVYAAAREEAAT